MDLSTMTGTQLLRAAGYIHRPCSETANTHRHEILDSVTHEVIARMTAHEASAFALAKLDGVLFTFNGWEVPRGIPRDEPAATSALRALAGAVRTILHGTSRAEIAGAGLDAAFRTAEAVLATLDERKPAPRKADTADERDDLLNEATHSAAAPFIEAGITMDTETLYRINDFLTEILDEVHPADRATRLGVDPRLIHGDE